MKRIRVKGRVLLNMIGRKSQLFEPKRTYEVDDQTADHPFLRDRLLFVEDIVTKEEKLETEEQKPVTVKKTSTRKRKSK